MTREELIALGIVAALLLLVPPIGPWVPIPDPVQLAQHQLDAKGRGAF
jgi:hypothetical protein